MGQGARVVWLSLLIAVCALATIGIVTYVGWHIGPLALGVGIAGAILPVPLLIACFLWLDRYEPSPMWIVTVSFLWGAGVATSGAYAVNTAMSSLFEQLQLSDALVGVLVAPVIEETLKAAFPLLLFVFYRRAYTGIIDGIVYCGLSATGFAMVENILYLGGHGFAGAEDQGYAAATLAATLIFILRVPLTGFAHPLFTSMTGLGLGFAARSPRPRGPGAGAADRPGRRDDAARHLEPDRHAGAERAVHPALRLLRGVHADLLLDGRAWCCGCGRGRDGWPSACWASTRPPAGSRRPRWWRWDPWAGGCRPGAGPAGSPATPGTPRCAATSSRRRGWRCCATASTRALPRADRPRRRGRRGAAAAGPGGRVPEGLRRSGSVHPAGVVERRDLPDPVPRRGDPYRAGAALPVVPVPYPLGSVPTYPG
jgi:RsiW-degrading membrane proteinase PrsW (M82 family)